VFFNFLFKNLVESTNRQIKKKPLDPLIILNFEIFVFVKIFQLKHRKMYFLIFLIF